MPQSECLNSFKKISPKIIIAHFNGNPLLYYHATVLQMLGHRTSAIMRQIPKHNVVFICGDFNTQLGQCTTVHNHTFHLATNQNGECLKAFITEQNLLCTNTKFKKKPGKQRKLNIQMVLRLS